LRRENGLKSKECHEAQAWSLHELHMEAMHKLMPDGSLDHGDVFSVHIDTTTMTAR
jgi:hypothetical protein